VGAAVAEENAGEDAGARPDAAVAAVATTTQGCVLAAVALSEPRTPFRAAVPGLKVKVVAVAALAWA
jgi:hypothetical protein